MKSSMIRFARSFDGVNWLHFYREKIYHRHWTPQIRPLSAPIRHHKGTCQLCASLIMGWILLALSRNWQRHTYCSSPQTSQIRRTNLCYYESACIFQFLNPTYASHHSCFNFPNQSLIIYNDTPQPMRRLQQQSKMVEMWESVSF